ncbi:MAG TPA: hypothetical protein VN922_16100, partial [Bacteroidia bacterium]|nr:hypothetical protein [Bacteroidia bacterium]
MLKDPLSKYTWVLWSAGGQLWLQRTTNLSSEQLTKQEKSKQPKYDRHFWTEIQDTILGDSSIL